MDDRAREIDEVLSLIQNRALGMMREHGLVGWRFAWDDRRRSYGRCQYGTKTISISRRLALLNGWDQTKETILHEIAHARVGPGHAHDAAWHAEARRLGCNGGARFGGEVAVPPRVQKFEFSKWADKEGR